MRFNNVAQIATVLVPGLFSNYVAALDLTVDDSSK